MRAALLMVAALGGCWRGAPPADPPPRVEDPPASAASYAALRARGPSECARVLDSTVEKLRPELAKTGMPEATIDEMEDAATASCEQMAWSIDLLGCYEAAATPMDLGPCQTLMTSEQSDDVTRRMMEVVSRMHALPPPPPPP